MAPIHASNIAQLLEPAIDGPPSPESLRALSNQMRQASAMEKHQSRQSHQTTSSSSSSRGSLTSAERPSWEQPFDTATSSLSRRSSGRSSASVQPRDRHDSVQIFGRTIFTKRGKLRRESSTQNSSNSSLFAAETLYETEDTILPPPPPLPLQPSGALSPRSSSIASSNSSTSNRDTLMSSFLGRRRATKPDNTDGPRKIQISEPYNFQHLTHTKNEHLPSLQRGSRAALQSDFAIARSSQSPTDSSLRGIHAESIYFTDFSSEALPLGANDTGSPTSGRRFPARQHASSVSGPPPSRTLFHTRSQDQLRGPPPRPPRSPIEASSFSPPIPPPRLSSRASIRYSDIDMMASNFIDRPRTSGGFRQPAPLSIPDDMPHLPPMHSHSYSADMDIMNMAAVNNHRFSQMTILPETAPMLVPDDSNWPLACPAPSTTTVDILPGVPEEDEHVHYNSVRMSRMSIASNSSSLRGSYSLPMLRQIAQAQNSSQQRPPSNASDTLGSFDVCSMQRALRDAISEEKQANSLAKESWEDDIDYCYEHEVEADCEYAWERPSLDLSRESSLDNGDNSSSHSSNETQKKESGLISPGSLSPGRFDVPGLLSPSSQISVASTNEAVTPTGLAMRRPSLTIHTKMAQDAALPLPRYLHVRSSSRASSFKESHGFNLSPSLFIPGSESYSDSFMMSGRPVGFAIGADDDLDDFPAYMEPNLTMDKSMLLVPSRTSASTTGSQESRDSMLSRRHISTTSTATDLTRLTMSTASIEDLLAKPDPECARAI